MTKMRLFLVSGLTVIAPAVFCASIPTEAADRPIGMASKVVLEHKPAPMDLLDELGQLQGDAADFFETLEVKVNEYLKEEAARRGWGEDMPQEMVPMLEAIPAKELVDEVLKKAGSQLLHLLNSTNTSTSLDMVLHGTVDRGAMKHNDDNNPFKDVVDDRAGALMDELWHGILKVLEVFLNSSSSELSNVSRPIVQHILNIINSLGGANLDSSTSLVLLGDTLNTLLTNGGHQMVHTLFTISRSQMQLLVKEILAQAPDTLEILTHPTEASVERLSKVINQALADVANNQ